MLLKKDLCLPVPLADTMTILCSLIVPFTKKFNTRLIIHNLPFTICIMPDMNDHGTVHMPWTITHSTLH